MTKEMALECARTSAIREGMAYCAIQARNGQWMRERYDYVYLEKESNYTDKQRNNAIVFNKKGERL